MSRPEITTTAELDSQVLNTVAHTKDRRKGLFKGPDSRKRQVLETAASATGIGLTLYAVRAGLNVIAPGQMALAAISVGVVRSSYEIHAKGMQSLMAEATGYDAGKTFKKKGLHNKIFGALKAYGAVDNTVGQIAAQGVDRLLNKGSDLSNMAETIRNGLDRDPNFRIGGVSSGTTSFDNQVESLRKLALLREYGYYQAFTSKDSNEKRKEYAEKFDIIYNSLKTEVYSAITAWQGSTNATEQAMAQEAINKLSKARRSKGHKLAVTLAYGGARSLATAGKVMWGHEVGHQAQSLIQNHEFARVLPNTLQRPHAPSAPGTTDTSAGGGAPTGTEDHTPNVPTDSGSGAGTLGGEPPVVPGPETPPIVVQPDEIPPVVIPQIELTTLKPGDTIGAYLKTFLTMNHALDGHSIWENRSAGYWAAFLVDNNDQPNLWDRIARLSEHNDKLKKALDAAGYLKGQGLKQASIDALAAKAASGDQVANGQLHELASHFNAGDKLKLAPTLLGKEAILPSVGKAELIIKAKDHAEAVGNEMVKARTAIRIDSDHPTVSHIVKQFRRNITESYKPNETYPPMFGPAKLAGPTWGDFFTHQLPSLDTSKPMDLLPSQTETWFQMEKISEAYGDSTLKELLGLSFHYNNANEWIATFTKPEEVKKLIDLANNGDVNAYNTLKRIFGRVPKNGLFLKSAF